MGAGIVQNGRTSRVCCEIQRVLRRSFQLRPARTSLVYLSAMVALPSPHPLFPFVRAVETGSARTSLHPPGRLSVHPSKSNAVLGRRIEQRQPAHRKSGPPAPGNRNKWRGIAPCWGCDALLPNCSPWDVPLLPRRLASCAICLHHPSTVVAVRQKEPDQTLVPLRSPRSTRSIFESILYKSVTQSNQFQLSTENHLTGFGVKPKIRHTMFQVETFGA